jgi:hypothetical protein
MRIEGRAMTLAERDAVWERAKRSERGEPGPE